MIGHLLERFHDYCAPWVFSWGKARSESSSPVTPHRGTAINAQRAPGAGGARSPALNPIAGEWAILSLYRRWRESLLRASPEYSLVAYLTPLKRVASLAPFSRLSGRKEMVRVCAMQRLFSMFPTGAAGIALALLRLTVAAMLLMIAFPRGDIISSQWAFAGLSVLAAFFFLGAFTPILCTLCCCIELAAVFGLRGVDALHMVFSIVDTAALGLLGPGGYSLDARMFGRRRVILSTDDNSGIN
jgi:hypothetical protein